uniref:poly(ADP-ribose) glycohydrolase n=2 Tax=Steinernema glaseri TaxID=37863 RepID=A0A1I7ZQ88_9BILA
MSEEYEDYITLINSISDSSDKATAEEAERFLSNRNRKAPCIVEEVDIKDVGDEPCFMERSLLESAERHFQRTSNMLSNRCSFFSKKPDAGDAPHDDSPKKSEAPSRKSDSPKPSTSGLNRLSLMTSPNMLSNRTKPLSPLFGVKTPPKNPEKPVRRPRSPTPSRQLPEAWSKSPERSPEPLDEDVEDIMATAEPVDDWEAVELEPADGSEKEEPIDEPETVEFSTPRSTRDMELLETSVESLHLESVDYTLAPDLRNRGPNDHILIDVYSIAKGKLPKPYPHACTDPTLGWSDYGKVRLPFSSARILKDGESAAQLVRQFLLLLTEPKNTIEDVTEVIDMYRPLNMNYSSLHALFNDHLSPEKRLHYLNFVIPGIAKLALQMDDLFTQGIPRLRAGTAATLTMSQQQAACLLAHAFLCTYPPCARHCTNLMQVFSFKGLFMRGHRTKIEKLKCILHYFDCVTKEMPNGVISIRRHVLSENVRFSMRPEPLCNLVVHEDGRIEDTNNEMLEIDFANKYIGGGVLNEGCVQEEIRFMLSPELLVSLLVCEQMNDNESISIVGTQRFSDYEGYSDTFRYVEREQKGSVIRDSSNRILSEVVAIDAILFWKPVRQFEGKYIFRELRKAYIGFANWDNLNRPIATGNWGCGAFRGDRQLKSLIQLAAASLCGRREMHYFTFNDVEFSRKLEEVYEVLAKNRITVGQVVKSILLFREENDPPETQFPLFDYVIEKVAQFVTSMEEKEEEGEE